MKGIPLTDGRAPPAAMSVSELNARVKNRLEPGFTDIWVGGEVSNLVRAASGHLYLSLKDDDSVVRAVIWRGTLPGLALEPVDGLAVVCHGRLEVYAPRGTYQLSIDRLHAVGTGALEARLRQLEARLAAEGLLAEERKRPLPTAPRRIALVTSPAGAAIADFLETLAARWPACAVVVVPARVQGAGAADEVAAAIARAGRLQPPVEAVAVVRGGGSLEDLWSFNEEAVARAVAACPVPVVSGVGHETDVTLCDLVADVRALTPTDAAVRLSPDRRPLLANLAALEPRLATLISRRIETERVRLDRLACSRALSVPRRLVADRRAAVVAGEERVARAAAVALARAAERLAAATARVEGVSPLRILARGYSVTTVAHGVDQALVLRDVAGLVPGDRLSTRLARGRFESVVERIIPDDPTDGPRCGGTAAR
ncbi:MAG: exodeoxyribonuclease VII large subunit [Planctomycetes bacterium]|nr:exodeoxyribonuclease VII large subunit [Planctomycetota bacterium]